MGVKRLAEGHNSMAQVGFEPLTLGSGAQVPKQLYKAATSHLVYDV